MALLSSNRGQKLGPSPKALDQHPRLFPQVLGSDQHHQSCLKDADTPSMARLSWHKELALSTIKSAQHGTLMSISLEKSHDSVDSSKFNRAQRKRRGLLQSPTSSCAQAVEASVVSPAIARDLRREMGWLKARTQHDRDRKRGRVHSIEMNNVLVNTGKRTISEAIGPERKRIAFVKEQDRKYIREDRAGTLHNSELQADDDVALLYSVEELSVGGEVDALAMSWHGCNATTFHGLESDR